MTRLGAIACLFALLACGTASAGRPKISVTGTWSRPATITAVVYGALHNDGSAGDRLLSATSPVATHVGLHRSFETMMTGMPMVNMKPVAWIDIPAHGTVVLKPGGYHLMLNLRHDLKAGDVVPIRWHFARAGWITTGVSVRAME